MWETFWQKDDKQVDSKDSWVLVEEKNYWKNDTSYNNGLGWVISFYFLGKIYLMILTFIHYFLFYLKYSSKLSINPLKVKAVIYFKIKKDYRFSTTQIII